MRKGFGCLCVLLTGFLFFNPHVSATEPDVVDSLIYLKGVVVSANKIKVNRNSVPLSISVIERHEIESSSESALLPVLSQRVPGLFVTQKGITGFGVSEGSAGTVNIRGVGQGNKVLMLFDGQPQWAGLFGHSLPDTYVASDVERVEVIRGPGSLLYGSNAMGGVVNIITRQHNQEGRRTQARVMYGSYNTQKYMINNGYNIGRLSTYISLNHDRTDGHRADSKFYMTNGFGKVGYTFSDSYKAIADISLAKYKNHNPGKITAPIIDNIMDILRGTASLALENNWSKGSGAIRAFYNWGVHDINDGYNRGSEPRKFLFHSEDHNVGLLVYQSFRLFPGNSFTVGIDYKNWGGLARNDSIHGVREELVDKSVDETAGYLIMQQDLFDKLSLNGGVRYEHNSTFGGEWIPQAGITFRPIEGNAIKASLSKGFRSPNIREMYMFPPQNPDLKPESMMNYEVSVGQTFLDGDLFAEVTAFYIDGKDMIQTERFDGRPKNVNTGKFYNKGVEVDARYQLRTHFSLDMNYSYLHTNKALLAAPKHKFFVGATYTPGRFTVDVNVQSIFDLYINTTDKVKEDYTVLNAKVAYRLGTREKGLNLFVKGENLTATKYTINEGFPMPKAVFMGGIDLTF
ncbi:TonB-dependent receptor [Parabacteroides sp. PF5-9]|uniref:TonB-dependent receptor plug domain-containing protein n=1 Tax=Parabacteroides sp. PF5-9 TaxID=1742404 RepID=UPI002475A35A|nr:TonB-dependent receptor [Parabacteroides sp. PF5-9]MDH6357388.1 vitamin B12 transporter [Parabacteroides sp. PF5-9]